MSVKKSNNTVSVISNGATVKKPEIAGVTYAGNLGIPAAVGQPSAVGLTGGGYAENIERYYGGGNSLAGGGSLTVSPANGNGLTGGLYGSFLGSGAGSSPVGSLTPATSLAGSALAGKNLTGGLYGQNLDRYFDSNVVGRVGAGIGGGASRGGVTNEGVIVGGSTGNLEKFPTIGNGNGNVSPRLPSNGSIGSRYPSPNLPSGLLDLKGSYTDRLNQFASGLFTPSKSTSAGTGTSSKDTNSDTNAEQTPPPATEETESSEPMTYEQYIEEAKKGYQAQLDAAKKQAEQTRQRAIVDAQSGYMQNLASYGANAEQMADAGMQGGGYSDYLNAQAYAQKRSDVQQANAQAAYENQAAEGTYQGYINSLNQQLAQKALDDQRIADQREYEQKQTEDERVYQQQLLEEQRKYEEEQYEKQKKEGMYGSLLDFVSDPNSGYTAEIIDEFAQQYGFDERQTQSLKSILSIVQKNAEEQDAKKASADLLQQALYDIESGVCNDSYLDTLKELGLTDEDYKKALLAKYRFETRNGLLVNTDNVESSYKNGDIGKEDYESLKNDWNNSIDASESFFTTDQGTISYADAKRALESVINNAWTSEDKKQALQKVFNKIYAVDIAKEYHGSHVKGGTVDIYSDGFSTTQFGDADGMGKSGDDQEEYAQRIIADAKAGKIKVGQVVSLNYGNVWNDYLCYVYIGDGIFVKCDTNSFSNPKGTYGDSLYVPDGYKIGGVNKSVRKA